MRCATLNLFDGLLTEAVNPLIAARVRRRREARLPSGPPDEQLALEFEPSRLCAGCVNSCKQHQDAVIIGCAKYVPDRKKAERR